ncbi:MAG: hypothetical protein KDC80_28755 [Saprospiraceae bacterium]|nr:hypothetical protein [Saprospiraceae bacterium]
MITFLHTAKVNIERFENLVRKYNAHIRVDHVVNEELLQYALRSGTVDIRGFTQTAQEIKRHAENLIVCTCSSYGEVCDQLMDIERIDRPVVEYLVSKYDHIGLAFTVKSTVPVSRQLIEECAANIKRPVEVIPIDCTGSWSHLENGDQESYAKTIAQEIRNSHQDCDAIFLAQASMENATQFLKDLDKEVLASPDFGVQYYLDQMEKSLK